MGMDANGQDGRIDGLRKGSIMLVIGWASLAMGSIFGVYFFQSLRDGTDLMRAVSAVLGALGLILVAKGTRMRHANS